MSANAGAVATPQFDSRALLELGLHHHQNGRMAEAERCYRQVLQRSPANVDALHFLGVLAHQINQHAQAAELIEKALRLNPADPNIHNNLGDTYRALGRFDDALACFQQALVLQPDFHEVRNNLGEIYRLTGNFAAAVDSFRQVLQHLPDYAPTHNNLGLTRQALGEVDAALACYRQALTCNPHYANAHNNLGELLRRLRRSDEAQVCLQQALVCNPNLAEAHNSLGMLLHEQGKVKDALTHFDCALKLKPDQAGTHYNFAAACKQQGHIEAALGSAQEALRLAPDEQSYWVLYADIVKLLPASALTQVNPSTLLAAMQKDDVDAQNLERIAIAVIFQTPQRQRWRDDMLPRDALNWQRLESDPEFIAFIETPLLRAVLEETIITDHRLERLLTKIRHALLEAQGVAQMPPVSSSVMRFSASLAQQCFANEYVFAVSAEEDQARSALTQKVAAGLQQGQPPAALALMLVASYQALYQLDFSSQILSVDCDLAIEPVLQRQLHEPMREEALKATMPRLTAIDNAVSQAVRQQYEESPYPRWRKCGQGGAGQPVEVVLRRLFPQQALPELVPSNNPAQTQVLVAGCGTGYHAIRAAQRFDNAEVLAVDLSLSSLAYAQRASEALGINNVQYQQADILGLAALHRRFDVVESCGVLHHMAEPLAGWRVLAELVRPGGVMFIGLYSERARRQVTALRQLIAAREYPASVDGIRCFRADALGGAPDIAIGDLALSPDFNSTSACRDLLFHVQEHLYTPLKIQSELQQLGLQFLGFDIPYPEIKLQYAARFPDNPAADSLENWDALEQDLPHAFAGMYQFWVRKPE